MKREQLSEIETEPFDVVIIGAGINGAGIARDAALRNLRVLLLDKGDVASGTSAWSTRLIHGGLRYLEHGEIKLVRESLRERELLLRLAPHLVKPLPFLIPIYAGRKRGPWMIRAGMLAYDLLSFEKTLAPPHRMLSRMETLERVPGLKAKNLRGAALYYDAQVQYAERLVLENALDARAHGASVLTYARVERIEVEDGAVRGVEFVDLLDGGRRHYNVRAPIVLNAAGPWVDEVLAKIEHDSHEERLIGGTKGSHLIVDLFDGAPRDALYVEARADGRPFFIIPWDDNKYLIGTTDVRYEGDLDAVEIDEREIEYLLDETNGLIPTAQLTRADILHTYSGVRPLPYIRQRSEQNITRRHFLREHTPQLRGFVSIIGGKLTTYRSLAEQTVDLLFRKLKRSSPACRTGKFALPGARCENFAAFVEEFRAEKSQLPTAANERLLRIYGTRAREVLKLCAEHPDLRESFSPQTGALGAEIVFSFREELAETLSDCLLRRTMVGFDRAAGLDAIEAAARIAQRYLGWSEERARLEIAAYREQIKRFRPRALADTKE